MTFRSLVRFGLPGGREAAANSDIMAALEQWVEGKKAPDTIAASRVRYGKVDRTRPLCPYPQIAKYKGSGSVDEAELHLRASIAKSRSPRHFPLG